MPSGSLMTLEIIESLENFLERRRPPENIRDKLDLDYKIEKQSVVILEIRPRWNKPEEKMESGIAKATFVKTKNHWKVFWMRSDLKWHSYSPKPDVKTIKDFVKLVEEDEFSCFWG